MVDNDVNKENRKFPLDMCLSLKFFKFFLIWNFSYNKMLLFGLVFVLFQLYILANTMFNFTQKEKHTGTAVRVILKCATWWR